MNVREARVALRPRSLSDVLDLAVPFVLTDLRLHLRLLAPIALPALAFLAVARRLGKIEWSVLWYGVALLYFLAEGVFTVAAGELLLRPAQQVRARDVYKRFLRRLGPYAIGRIGRGLALLVSSFLVVAPAFVATPYLFSHEAVLLEGAGPWQSLRRSSALVQGRWFFGFGLWATTLLMPVGFAVLAELLGGTLVELVLQLGRPFGALWTDGGSGLSVLGVFLSLPVAAAMRFLGYIDLRTRKEGWDLQLRFMAIAQAMDEDAEGRKGVA